MSLWRIHLKKLVGQAANQGLHSCERHLGFFSQWFRVTSPQPWNPVTCVKMGELVAGIRLLCTTGEEPQVQPVIKKKENPNAKKEIGNVGRLIPYNVIQVINENGEDMGKINKTKVIQIMQERDLKLVVHQENANPPVYRLMTGKQLFEEQTKLREKQKLSSGSDVQIKEMSFRASIEKHDLDVKIKQLSQWIEKKQHVRVTILNSRFKDGPDKEDVLRELLQSMQNQATCSSNPKARKDGQAMLCVLRPLSKKELQKQKKDLEKGNQEEPITKQETNLKQSPNTELPNP